jgi:hypothetical protein
VKKKFIVVRCLCGREYYLLPEQTERDCQCGAHLEKAADGIFSAFVDNETYPFHEMPYRKPGQYETEIECESVEYV